MSGNDAITKACIAAFHLGENPHFSRHSNTEFQLEFVDGLAWDHLGVPAEELEQVTGARKVWVSLLRLQQPHSTQLLRRKGSNVKIKMRPCISSWGLRNAGQNNPWRD